MISCCLAYIWDLLSLVIFSGKIYYVQCVLHSRCVKRTNANQIRMRVRSVRISLSILINLFVGLFACLLPCVFAFMYVCMSICWSCIYTIVLLRSTLYILHCRCWGMMIWCGGRANHNAGDEQMYVWLRVMKHILLSWHNASLYLFVCMYACWYIMHLHHLFIALYILHCRCWGMIRWCGGRANHNSGDEQM